MREEINKEMEKPQKKESNRNLGNKSLLKSNKKYRGKPLQQNKGRQISGLEDKMDIKEKSELLDKRLKSCERNTQELNDSIKRPNLQRRRGANQRDT
jgi:hypothetical protein